MNDSTARSVATVGIWLASAIVLTFGVFHTTWNGGIALLMMFILVLVICGAAAASTAFVWGWKPPTRPPATSPTEVKT